MPKETCWRYSVGIMRTEICTFQDYCYIKLTCYRYETGLGAYLYYMSNTLQKLYVLW